MTSGFAKILIVDDEKDFCDILFRVLKRAGFTSLVAHDAEMALDMIRLGLPDVVLLDVKMPGMDGMEALRKAKQMSPELPIIMVTAYSGVHGAVEAIKDGAFDYLSKPLDNQVLIEKIRRALATRSLVSKKKAPLLKKKDLSLVQLKDMMGPSQEVTRIISDLRLVSASDFSVVIQGETGTGKELIAQAVHQASLRSEAALIPVDCGAIPETLFESELFGYEKGAFTGAVSSRPGKFEMAQGGTLFLDEVANMPVSCQTKLLRAIQEKSFFRVGGREPVEVDVRLIVATNKDLNLEVAAGQFSRDLFYRLSEFTIFIPPIRERKEDIMHMAERFIHATNVELNKNVLGFSAECVSAIVTYKWPGNVRQLRAAIRRAVLQATDYIHPRHLSIHDSEQPRDEPVQKKDETGEWEGLSLREIVHKSIADVESKVILKALRKTGGNKAKAARLLQIDYKTMHSKIKQYSIRLYSEDDDGEES
jgi:two-component system nitrogen regulation response regulator GlnG